MVESKTVGQLHWHIPFNISAPLANLPCPRFVGHETQFGPAYRHAGRDRSHDPHGLFKYTLSGTGGISIGPREYRTPAGTGFLCLVADPDVVYYYPAECTEPWEFVWLSFRGEMAYRIAGDLIERYGPVFSLPPWHAIIKRLLELGRYVGGSIDLYHSEGAQLVMDVLLTLLHSKETSGTGHEATLVGEAVRRMDDDPRANVTTVASALGISREHFTRIFRRSMGVTPHEYLHGRRVLLACRLLKTTRLKIAQIAAQSGYTDLASFARSFRNAMQCTPGEFRRTGVIPKF